MKRILLAVVFVLIYGTAFAVNTTSVGTSLKVIQIVPDGSTDWVWEADIAGLTGFTSNQLSKLKTSKIRRIVFYPSAANDRMILHDGGIDNAAFFDSGLVSGADDPRTVTYDPPERVRIVIDATDNTTDTASSCKVLIYLEN